MKGKYYKNSFDCLIDLIPQERYIAIYKADWFTISQDDTIDDFILKEIKNGKFILVKRDRKNKIYCYQSKDNTYILIKGYKEVVPYMSLNISDHVILPKKDFTFYDLINYLNGQENKLIIISDNHLNKIIMLYDIESNQELENVMNNIYCYQLGAPVDYNSILKFERNLFVFGKYNIGFYNFPREIKLYKTCQINFNYNVFQYDYNHKAMGHFKTSKETELIRLYEEELNVSYFLFIIKVILQSKNVNEFVYIPNLKNPKIEYVDEDGTKFEFVFYNLSKSDIMKELNSQKEKELVTVLKQGTDRYLVTFVDGHVV